MRVLITGGAGVLGSSLAELLTKKGFRIKVIDIVRKEEAWRLAEVMNEIEYVWKSTMDITSSDVENIDIVFDCSIGVADRPFGTISPVHTVLNNLLPPLRLLETVSKLREKPLVIYPSSFNALYGHVGGVYREDTPVAPVSVYGFTKACAELLYLTYHKSYGVPVIVTRTASSYGPKGRCYSGDTEVLTVNGWKPISSVSVGERVYTLNPETFKIEEATVVNTYRYFYEGEMYHIANQFVDLLVTPNHKMVFTPYYSSKLLRVPIEDMLNYSYVRFFNTGRWDGASPTALKLTIQKKYCLNCGAVTKFFGAKEPRCKRCGSRKVELVRENLELPVGDFVKFFGFWLGDGSLGKRKSSEVVITQKKEKQLADVEKLVRRLFKTFTITLKRESPKRGAKQIIVHSRPLYDFLSLLGKKERRYIPEQFKNLSPPLLRTLLEWLARADGTFYRGSRVVNDPSEATKAVIYTSSPRLRDDIMEVALKAGFSARFYTRPAGMASVIGGRRVVSKLDNYGVTITVGNVGNNPVLEVAKVLRGSHHYFGRRTVIERVPYRGYVYDIEVNRNHIIYVRRNGKPIWGSNSDELPHRLIIHCLKNRDFYLRSPRARRLWTFVGDVKSFYERLVERISSGEDFSGLVLHCCGNKGDRIVENIELAQLIKELTGSNISIIEGHYEPGELVGGKPIDFRIDSSFTRELLGWEPRWSLEDGLKVTIEWFKKNIDRYL